MLSHKSLIKTSAGFADDGIDGKPNDKIRHNERKTEDKQYYRLKGNPRVNDIAERVGKEEEREVAKKRLRYRPLFNLVEDRCSRLNKGENIGRNDGEENLVSAEREVV